MDLLGKIWALPNTLIGLLLGLCGHATAWLGNRLKLYDHQPGITLGNNAVQFHNNPLMVFGALSLGNTICYGCRCSDHTHGEHERQHTIQAQWLGPFYLPLHIFAQLLSILTYPVVAWRGPTLIHGKANFLETGPMSTPPRPWLWKTLF